MVNINQRNFNEREGAEQGVGGSQGVAASNGGDAIQPEDSFDCKSLAVSIQQMLDRTSSLSQMSQRRPCIYRVPKLLRKLKEEAYTPVQVSIGPFHHKDERLLPMDTHKLMYLPSFIENSKTNSDLNTYLEIIKDKERQIRECYAEPIDMGRDEFIKMILIDSIFVIELLRTRDLVMPFTKGEILHDLRLAENQLPFFILEDLYSAAFKKPDKNMSFTHLVCNFLKFEIDPITHEAASSCYHLLDLLRSHRLSPVGVDDTDKTSINPLCHTATRLCKGELVFAVKDNKKYGLLDIDFNSETQTLSIPELLVEEGTESLFRNLIAYEVCRYPSACYIVHYQFFLTRLINTEEDVKLLSKAGIIHNWLPSDKKVADLFNSLGTNVCWDHRRYYYAKIANQLNERCNKS